MVERKNGRGLEASNNMSRKGWKAAERQAAKAIGGSRYPANMGGRIDVEGPSYVGQVKNVKVLSLARLEWLAVEMSCAGALKNKRGLVIVKRSAGKGTSTPYLYVTVDTPFIERSDQ